MSSSLENYTLGRIKNIFH